MDDGFSQIIAAGGMTFLAGMALGILFGLYICYLLGTSRKKN